VNRLNQLVNDLLDTSRISSGKMVIYPQQFNINVLITEKIEDLRQLSQKHVFATKSTEPINIVADRERIGQVLINLLSNAVKYSPGGGEILITSEKIDDNVRVSVKDGGIGISKDILNKVFDRFFRAGGAVMNTYPGMGLGLFISAEIIHRHGGTISVDSEEGKGAIFYFTLPVK
jgi:signal transduction histidine kinase